MKRSLILLIAAAALAAGCNDKETRNGSITLTGSGRIPLVDKSGAHAELVAGSAQITFQKGSKDRTVDIVVRQPNRPDVTVEAPLKGDPTSGDFVLRGADSGQPVDIASSRRYAVTGPTQRWSNWEDQGFDRCLVEYSYDPCDEDWTVSFAGAAGALGSFAAHTPTRCNERRDQAFCQPIPGREPRIPDIPRGPHGRGLAESVLSADPSSVKFD